MHRSGATSSGCMQRAPSSRKPSRLSTGATSSRPWRSRALAHPTQQHTAGRLACPRDHLLGGGGNPVEQRPNRPRASCLGSLCLSEYVLRWGRCSLLGRRSPWHCRHPYRCRPPWGFRHSWDGRRQWAIAHGIAAVNGTATAHGTATANRIAAVDEVAAIATAHGITTAHGPPLPMGAPLPMESPPSRGSPQSTRPPPPKGPPAPKGPPLPPPTGPPPTGSLQLVGCPAEALGWMEFELACVEPPNSHKHAALGRFVDTRPRSYPVAIAAEGRRPDVGPVCAHPLPPPAFASGRRPGSAISDLLRRRRRAPPRAPHVARQAPVFGGDARPLAGGAQLEAPEQHRRGLRRVAQRGCPAPLASQDPASRRDLGARVHMRAHAPAAWMFSADHLMVRARALAGPAAPPLGGGVGGLARMLRPFVFPALGWWRTSRLLAGARLLGVPRPPFLSCSLPPPFGAGSRKVRWLLPGGVEFVIRLSSPYTCARA